LAVSLLDGYQANSVIGQGQIDNAVASHVGHGDLVGATSLGDGGTTWYLNGCENTEAEELFFHQEHFF